MSRWLWALLGGVVLVAIAAVFWIANNQTNTPPVSPAPTPVTPAPAPAPAAQNVAPSPPAAPPPTPSPPAEQQAAAPPPPAPNPTPDAGHEAASPPAPAPSPATPPAPTVAAQQPSPPAPLANPPLPPPAPGREAQPAPAREAQDVASAYAPKSLAQLVGTWAYSTADCEKLFQRRGGGWAFRQPVDKFAQAAIVESPKRIVLPSAICQIDGASQAQGALKVNAECQDSISYTPRSVMIALRSATELIYSASGDVALATTLMKCPP